MITVTLDEILSLTKIHEEEKPQLEQYFSPSKKKQFIKDYRHFLNTCLLEARHGNLDKDLYLVLVLSFQFIAPLLEIPVKKELELFYQVLSERYDIEDPDINLHFSPDEYEGGMISEEEALEIFREELDESYTGRREIKESVQKRLKQDGIKAVMHWQQKKALPELAEAFGRSIVIPEFFSFTDKKLVNFYRSATAGINYEVMVPVFGEE
ncbi:MAG: hypothetical protein ACP5EQ_08395 [Candidatus Cloacimonadia bacterium]